MVTNGSVAMAMPASTIAAQPQPGGAIGSRKNNGAAKR
jgi:hypothetical protein